MNKAYQQQGRNFDPYTNVKIIPAMADRANQTKEKPKKRVCAYCRVSTDEEDQQSSYDLQVGHYTDFIKSNVIWEFSGVYADEGISGTSIKNRTDFQRMIEDCKAGKIDMIITKSISRFARNTLDCLNYVRMLKGMPSPVGIYFEKENIDTLDAKSELLLTILSSLAQDESRSISENVRWSIQKRYQQGKAHCPTAFFLGYDKDKGGNLVINEQQAKTVRSIYQEFLNGNGTNRIAKNLTENKVKTGKGKPKWCANSVYRILRNEKYCGDILMQKRVTLDFLTHKRVPNKGHQPQYFIADHHPAIIPKEIWKNVQLELDRRYKMHAENENGKPQKHSNRTVFSNILYCGTCEEPLVRRTYTSFRKNERYYYVAWRCRVADGRIKNRECNARSYREEAMEHTFMVMLQEMKDDVESIREEAQNMIRNFELDDWEMDRMDFLKIEIKALEGRLNQVAASAVRSIAGDVYDDMSIELDKEIDGLQAEWESLNEKQYEVLITKRNLEWVLDEIKSIPEFDPGNERTDFREDIFRRIVVRGDVFDDGSILYEMNIGISRKAINNYNPIWKIPKKQKAN